MWLWPPSTAQQEPRMDSHPEQGQGSAGAAIWGPQRAENPQNKLGKGMLERASIWAVGSQYSLEAWGVRRKSRGQQGLRYGARRGQKIPKTSWMWMHPHGCDVTQFHTLQRHKTLRGVNFGCDEERKSFGNASRAMYWIANDRRIEDLNPMKRVYHGGNCGPKRDLLDMEIIRHGNFEMNDRLRTPVGHPPLHLARYAVNTSRVAQNWSVFTIRNPKRDPGIVDMSLPDDLGGFCIANNVGYHPRHFGDAPAAMHFDATPSDGRSRRKWAVAALHELANVWSGSLPPGQMLPPSANHLARGSTGWNQTGCEGFSANKTHISSPSESRNFEESDVTLSGVRSECGIETQNSTVSTGVSIAAEIFFYLKPPCPGLAATSRFFLKAELGEHVDESSLSEHLSTLRPMRNLEVIPDVRTNPVMCMYFTVSDAARLPVKDPSCTYKALKLTMDVVVLPRSHRSLTAYLFQVQSESSAAISMKPENVNQYTALIPKESSSIVCQLLTYLAIFIGRSGGIWQWYTGLTIQHSIT
ncbi:hypothetical protein DFH09DRAFT_1087881 [Mycena vulgaris]|nr:hypothetical protein DFH09DRAFT_1087881 [Mycena vulgaris]